MFFAVLGANYGCENKGLIVDYLADKYSTDLVLCVKHKNVPSLHRVQHPNGIVHDFSHFSSGTLAGARTFWCGEFICEPAKFKEERESLIEKRVIPTTIFVEKYTRVKTPYDTIMEDLGFTNLVNHRFSNYSTPVYKPMKLFAISEIKEFYAREINLRTKLSPEKYEIWSSPETASEFIRDCEYVESCIKVKERITISEYPTVIFEGNKGLELDGMRYGCAFLEDFQPYIGSEILHIYYVTRPYLTVTGFNKEDFTPDIIDPTLTGRSFKRLNLDRLIRIINDDNYYSLRKPYLGVTCLDQIKDQKIEVYERTHKKLITSSELLYLLRAKFPSSKDLLFAEGPTRLNVRTPG